MGLGGDGGGGKGGGGRGTPVHPFTCGLDALPLSYGGLGVKRGHIT